MNPLELLHTSYTCTDLRQPLSPTHLCGELAQLCAQLVQLGRRQQDCVQLSDHQRHEVQVGVGAQRARQGAEDLFGAQQDAQLPAGVKQTGRQPTLRRS